MLSGTRKFLQERLVNVNSMLLSGRWKYICGSREKTVTDAINDDKSKETHTYNPL